MQAHTNLTEIKLAAELFWRVNIPPSKIALGFGFYGRAFTLADPSCNTPGCPFSVSTELAVFSVYFSYSMNKLTPMSYRAVQKRAHVLQLAATLHITKFGTS